MARASLVVWILAGSILANGPLPADTAEGVVLFHESRLSELAMDVRLGGELRIEAVPLDGVAAVLELRRFRLFAPGSRIVVHAGGGTQAAALGRRAFFSGTLAGDAETFVFLAVTESGLRGLITVRGQAYEIRQEEGGPPRVEAVAPEDPAGGWACGAGELPALGARPAPPIPATGPIAGTPEYAVDLAVDSDWEFFQRFGSVEAATDYAATLIGAASAIYERDVSTRLQIRQLILWATPDDPWTVTSDLFEALYELGDYWHAHHAGVERTTVHWLSGKSGLAGGVAYGGVLCSPDLPYQGHWAGGYGLSGALALTGTFRDTFVVSHELGHNFDSRHTHCYNGIPAPQDPPIDLCFSGDVTGGRPCYAGTTSLPPDGGSIMSYCHLQPGGYGNIQLWLGREGSYGERSERVLQEMLNHVRSVACLPPPGAIFADGFESGDTSAW